MIYLSVPSLPLWGYLQTLTWITGLLIILGGVVLAVFPEQIRKIALLWGLVGFSQVVFSGFFLYPYEVFGFFPNEVAFGLFVLTSGVVLSTLDSLKAKKGSKPISVVILVLGFVELYFFIDFFNKFPDFTKWNITINATPYYALLAAALATIICANLRLLIKNPKSVSLSQGASYKGPTQQRMRQLLQV
jgi:hypothetical protein